MHRSPSTFYQSYKTEYAPSVPSRTPRLLLLATTVLAAIALLVCPIVILHRNGGLLGYSVQPAPSTMATMRPLPSFRFSTPRRCPSLPLRRQALNDGKKFITLDDLQEFGNTFDSYKNVVDAGFKPEQLDSKLKEGYHILDVRPMFEVDRIRPKESTHVPFITEEVQDGGLKSLVSKWYYLNRELAIENYRHLIIHLKVDFDEKTQNSNFADEVAKKFWRKKKGAKIIVACGEGPRSLLAAKALTEAGFEDSHWLAGGFAAVPEGVLQSEGTGGVGYSLASVSGRKIAGEVAEGMMKAGNAAFSAFKDKFSDADAASTFSAIKDKLNTAAGVKTKEMEDAEIMTVAVIAVVVARNVDVDVKVAQRKQRCAVATIITIFIMFAITFMGGAMTEERFILKATRNNHSSDNFRWEIGGIKKFQAVMAASAACRARPRSKGLQGGGAGTGADTADKEGDSNEEQQPKNKKKKKRSVYRISLMFKIDESAIVITGKKKKKRLDFQAETGLLNAPDQDLLTKQQQQFQTIPHQHQHQPGSKMEDDEGAELAGVADGKGEDGYCSDDAEANNRMKWGYYDPREDEPFWNDWSILAAARYDDDASLLCLISFASGKIPLTLQMAIAGSPQCLIIEENRDFYGDGAKMISYFEVSPEMKKLGEEWKRYNQLQCKECNKTGDVITAYNFSTCGTCFRRMAEEENWYFGLRQYPWQDVKEWLIYKNKYEFDSDEPSAPTNITWWNEQMRYRSKELQNYILIGRWVSPSILHYFHHHFVAKILKLDRTRELEEKTGVKLVKEGKQKIDSDSRFDPVTHYGFGRLNPKQMDDDLEKDYDEDPEEGRLPNYLLEEEWANI
eukprot:jgi/Bigna1/76964/fgenesh1_pg.45_\